ncbi:MAG TPA: DNA methyltransferase, partial [Ktedonobacteraceae bacterium]|nr:DNA methyltransferase [Ktedonobacteraceae bacterium]
MPIKILVGNCRDTLKTLEPESVQSCITSPPYYGLRDYGTDPLIWGGDVEHLHQWTPANSARRIYTDIATIPGESSTVAATAHHVGASRANASPGDTCECGAWLGSLGLEPTVELYVEHLVECFREVKRVLRKDGTLWLNIGDSYS